MFGNLTKNILTIFYPPDRCCLWLENDKYCFFLIKTAAMKKYIVRYPYKVYNLAVISLHG